MLFISLYILNFDVSRKHDFIDKINYLSKSWSQIPQIIHIFKIVFYSSLIALILEYTNSKINAHRPN